MGDRRDLAVLQAEHGLDEAGDSGCGIQVSDVSLDCSQGAKAALFGLSAKGLEERLKLDGISHGRPRSMGLDQCDALRTNACRLHRPGYGARLSLDAGRGESGLGRPIVVHARSANDCADAIAVRLGSAQTFERHHARSASCHSALGGGVEWTAASIGREDSAFLVQVAGRSREAQGNAAGQGHFALVVEQCPTGAMNRDKRRRTGRLEIDAWARQVEFVGDPGSERVALVAQEHLKLTRSLRESRVAQETLLQIAVSASASKYGDSTLEARRIAAGVLQGLHGDFKCQTLLRVETLGFSRSHGEEFGVEPVGSFDDPLGANVVGIVQLLDGNPGPKEIRVVKAADGITRLAEIAPKLVEIGRSRETSGHAHDGDRFAVGLGFDQARNYRLLSSAIREVCRKRTDGGIAIEFREAQLPVQPLFQASVQLGQEERVAAEVEEVGVDPDLCLQ